MPKVVQKQGPQDWKPVVADLSLFDKLASFYEKREGLVDYSNLRCMQDGVKLAKTLNVKPGNEVFVVKPSLSMWTEIAMSAMGSHVTFLERDTTRFNLKTEVLNRILEDMNSAGVPELRRAVENNCRSVEGNFLRDYPRENTVDVVCFSCVLDVVALADRNLADGMLLKALNALKKEGGLAVGFFTDNYGNKDIKRVASENKIVLEEVPSKILYGDEVKDGGIFRIVSKSGKN